MQHRVIDGVKTELTDKIDRVDNKIDATRTELADKINATKSEVIAIINTFKAEIRAESAEMRREFNGKYKFAIGLFLTSWLSTMGTILFK